VPHSIDVRRFADPANAYALAAQEWRKELGIADDALVIGFAGKLQSKKAPELLLRAFQALDQPAQLVFFGSGALEAQLRAQAGTTSNVHFLPFQNQSQMPIVYRCCDLFVLPSRGPGETWGLALNEAMASGRAVVASTRVGGARDLIVSGVNGETFASGDIGELTRCLRSLLALGRSELHRMGAAGQAMSAAWTSERTAERIADAVQSVCA
jgi:glycosyltransferase involved in cell wall biosynthesis